MLFAYKEGLRQEVFNSTKPIFLFSFSFLFLFPFFIFASRSYKYELSWYLQLMVNLKKKICPDLKNKDVVVFPKEVDFQSLK